MTEEASGPMPLEAMQSRSGLELMQALAAGEMSRPGIGKLMDFSLGEVERGRVEFVSTPGPQHYNPLGTVHGGFAATLLDSCMGCAVHTTLAAGIGYTTIDINVTYLRAMTAATGPVSARGEVISSGRRVATARGTLTDSSGRVLATATTSCLVFPLHEGPKRA
ncbi:PaaI family thioesterase [Glacieibacterium sp.]|uniref:PaaI family thioesterase n=1 Tax=Glacieibacterium sp. TaxID=2860237 RepID=UPI003B0009A7